MLKTELVSGMTVGLSVVFELCAVIGPVVKELLAGGKLRKKDGWVIVGELFADVELSVLGNSLGTEPGVGREHEDTSHMKDAMTTTQAPETNSLHFDMPIKLT